MTDAIPTDLAKAMASAKPAAPAPKPADKPTDKLIDKPAKVPDAKAPDAAKGGNAPPPPPGSKTFLGWVAGSVSKKQIGVTVAAALSLVAGIAVVRYLLPEEHLKPTADATQPLAAEPESAKMPRGGPTVTIEPPKPGDFIPPASLPVPPVVPVSAAPSTPPSPAGGVIIPPPPAGLEPLPLIPVVGGGSATPMPPVKDKPVAPLGEKPMIPEPGSLAPSVVPAGGPPAAPTRPDKSETGGNTLPIIPPAGAVPPVPMEPDLPKLPGMAPSAPAKTDPDPKPAIPDPKDLTGSSPTPPAIPDPKDLAGSSPNPPSAIPGKPVGESPTPPAKRPEPPASLVPPVGAGRASTPEPMDLNPSPARPATPAAGGSGTGAKTEFVKPADSNTVTPVGGTIRPPATSYDVDIYLPKPNDTWEAISREYYTDTRFAAALRAYNQNRALAPGREVEVPPISILRQRYSPPAAGPAAATPAGTPGASGDPWNAAGAPTGGAKTYRIPSGNGMSLKAVAKLLLGNDQRWQELYDLNPNVNPSGVPPGTELKLPADARVR